MGCLFVVHRGRGGGGYRFTPVFRIHHSREASEQTGGEEEKKKEKKACT